MWHATTEVSAVPNRLTHMYMFFGLLGDDGVYYIVRYMAFVAKDLYL